MNVDKRDCVKGSPVISSIHFGIKRYNYQALLDSGSDVSLLEWSIFEQIPRKNILKIWKNTNVPLSSASGHELKTVGKAKIYVYINNLRYTINVILTKGFKYQLLIGSDFIYDHKAKLDFENNTMIINNRVILLKCKHELVNCSLLETTGTELIRPYCVTHIDVRPRNRSFNADNDCIITPLDNTILFNNQPGVTSPNIVVRKSNSNDCIFTVPIINNTSRRFHVKKRNLVAFIETIESNNNTDNYELTNNSAHLSVNPLTTAPLHPSEHTSNIKLGKPSHKKSKQDRSLQPLTYNIGVSENTDRHKTLIDLLHKHDDVFVDDIRQLQQTNILQASLNTGNSAPIRQRPYKTPLALQADVDKQIDEMLEAGIISPSFSPWASPLVIVPKKDGSIRICCDYRKFNQVLVKDSYPMSRIEEIFATLHNAKYFSTLDLKSSYHQIAIVPEDREKTAFCTRTALYEYNTVPFGLSTSGNWFTRMIHILLSGIESKFAVAYLDDILVFSETFEDHITHLNEVFTRLSNAKLSLNRKKCHFVKPEVEYLGHIVSPEGIKPNPEKTRAIQTMDPPTTVKDVRSFFGAVNYYRAYIENCSAIARPLTKLTHKNATFNWDDDCQHAFDYLKDKLIEAPILGYPDVSKPFSLYTDASEYSIGGILTQNTENGEKVICYISHQLTSSRLHYPVIEKECFAIIYCLTKLRQYLLGADVTVYTDHAPLRSLFTAEMKNTRVQRWAILLDEYQVKIKYMRGQLNCRADFLSRLRVKPTSEEIKQSNEIVAIEQGHDRDTRTYKDIIYDNDIDMEQLQADDEHCKRCITQLQNDNEKYTNDYILDNKLLFHFGKENRFETEPFLQLVIPREITNIVLEAYHSELGAGHVGFEKTYQKIRSKYFWPNCYKDVVNFVTKCQVCQRRMLRKKSAELQEHVTPQYPMEFVGIDTVGPMITSNNGNNYIVTVVDWYTSWVEAYPVPNKEADTIAKVLLERFIPQHGCPRALISDRGSEYVNNAIDLLSTKMKINRRIGSAYHPEFNGRTERCHRFLNDIIAKGLQNKDHSEWEEVLPCALFAMRTCVNDSTKYCPYELIYGRLPQLPLDTLLRPRRRYYGEEYVPTMLQRLHKAFTHVAANTKHAREEIKRQADKRASQKKFEVGDPVYLHDPTVKPGELKKLKSPWKSYYRIIEMISPVTVVILNQKTCMSKSVHVNNLRYANIGDNWNFERSDDSDSNDEEFKEQNTRKWVRPKRIQPKRRVKRSLRNEVSDNNLSEESNMNNSSDENTEIESEEREEHVVFTPSERRIQPQVTVHHETGINHQDPVEIVGNEQLVEKSRLHNVVDKQSEAIPSTSTGKVHTSKYNLRSRPFNRIDHSVKTNNIDSSTDDESNMDIPTVDGESAVSKHRDSDSDNTVIYDSDEFDHVPRGIKRGRAPSSSGDSISDVESDNYVLHQARKMSRINSSESDNSDDNQDDDLDDITDNIGDQTVNVVSHKSNK